MKTAIVYYSYDENTDYMAKMVAKKLDADLIRIDTAKKYPKGNIKFLVCGASASFGTKPKLKPYIFDASEYDTVIIGTPTWASTFTPPIKTFLGTHDLSGKTIGYIICSSSEDNLKCKSRLDKEIGKNCKAALCTINPFTHLYNNSTQNAEELVDNFCKEMLS